LHGAYATVKARLQHHLYPRSYSQSS
jgi:hypothetical protein